MNEGQGRSAPASRSRVRQAVWTMGIKVLGRKAVQSRAMRQVADCAFLGGREAW